MNLEYKSLYKSTSFGSVGAFGIEVLIASSAVPDLHKLTALQDIAYDMARKLESEAKAAIRAADPETAKLTEANRRELLALFPSPIFVETIPNGYDPDYYRHLPWFIVTTSVGRFKIGWRKRVIQIDWTETVGTDIALNLFPHEDVTKEGRMIHAWDYDKAREYIAHIIGTANPAPSQGK